MTQQLQSLLRVAGIRQQSSVVVHASLASLGSTPYPRSKSRVAGCRYTALRQLGTQIAVCTRRTHVCTTPANHTFRRAAKDAAKRAKSCSLLLTSPLHRPKRKLVASKSGKSEPCIGIIQRSWSPRTRSRSANLRCGSYNTVDRTSTLLGVGTQATIGDG